jgi:hypothetical protein
MKIFILNRTDLGTAPAQQDTAKNGAKFILAETDLAEGLKVGDKATATYVSGKDTVKTDIEVVNVRGYGYEVKPVIAKGETKGKAAKK